MVTVPLSYCSTSSNQCLLFLLAGCAYRASDCRHLTEGCLFSSSCYRQLALSRVLLVSVLQPAQRIACPAVAVHTLRAQPVPDPICFVSSSAVASRSLTTYFHLQSTIISVSCSPDLKFGPVSAFTGRDCNSHSCLFSSVACHQFVDQIGLQQ